MNNISPREMRIRCNISRVAHLPISAISDASGRQHAAQPSYTVLPTYHLAVWPSCQPTSWANCICLLTIEQNKIRGILSHFSMIIAIIMGGSLTFKVHFIDSRLNIYVRLYLARIRPSNRQNNFFG